LVACPVRFERAVSEIGARQVIKKPKTAASVRTIAFTLWLMSELRSHFDTYAELGEDGRVFVGPKGATPLRPNFTSEWARALNGAGLAGIHIHDLRHTGNHFAAMTGGEYSRADGADGARKHGCGPVILIRSLKSFISCHCLCHAR
jgi:integrase